MNFVFFFALVCPSVIRWKVAIDPARMKTWAQCLFFPLWFLCWFSLIFPPRLPPSLSSPPVSFLYCPLLLFLLLLPHSCSLLLLFCLSLPLSSPRLGRSSLFPFEDGFLDDGHGDQSMTPGMGSPTRCQNGERIERYSRKVFVGGLPPDIDEGMNDLISLIVFSIWRGCLNSQRAFSKRPRLLVFCYSVSPAMLEALSEVTTAYGLVAVTSYCWKKQRL